MSQRLASELGMPLLIAQILVNRGIRERDTAQEFLYPSLSNLHPPWKMKDISSAVDRIRQAIDKGEKIWIYGDYDVDGITSVSLLLLCLKRIGADVNYYIPHRIDEGYGLNREGLTELRNRGCDLIITVDCGITSVEEVQFANDSGMEVIVTDHHQPADKLPPALVILDPKLAECEYPFDGLAGVGVAFKLAQALMGDEKGQDTANIWDQLDLVALGTMVDVVPLIGENRIIAKFGLEALNKSERPGIRALCEVAKIKPGSINSWTVAYCLGPRINAAGRIDTALNAVRLVTSHSYEEALQIAQKLDNANRDRQNIERFVVERAKKQLQQLDISQEKSLILMEEGWHPGVIGIVASKLQEEFYRPTILISFEGEIGRGSARSIPGFDIFDALSKCSHYFEKFGGHKSAAGFSIAKKNVPGFCKEFSQIIADSLDYEDLQRKITVDAVTSISYLSEEVVEKLSLLEPYGQDNPEPLIAITNLSVKGLPRVVGKNGEHLQVTVSDGQNSMRAIAFNMANLERELLNKNVKLDLVCRPQIDVWNDIRSVQLNIKEAIIYHDDSPEITIASAEVTELPQFKIVDRRNIPDKKRYLQNLLLRKEKALMYVRDDPAVTFLHRIASSGVPKVRLSLCYSTTPEAERDRMKSMLVQGELNAVISCVPFEEPLPGLKHIVFCHPVPTFDIFANSCAPAIEADEPVHIHLIFNNNDIDLLSASLDCQYPDRDILANVYRKIRELCNDRDGLPLSIEELVAKMLIDGPKELIISNCVAILEELSLVEQRQDGEKGLISISPAPKERRDLRESRLYSEGERIKREWSQFREFLLKKTAEDLRRKLLESI